MTRRKPIIPRRNVSLAMLPMPEKELAANVEDACKKLGWRYYHNVPTRRDYPHVTSKGFPDYVLVKKGRLLFVELKAESKLPTPEQEGWLADLYRCGDVYCYVWRPEDWHSGRILEVLQRG